MDDRTCSKCAQLQPLDQFYKGKGYADGFRRQCKTCLYRANAILVQSNRETRHCGKCGEDKLVFEFSRSKNKSSWCRTCCAQSAKLWRDSNLEKARQKDRDRQARQQTDKAKEWMRFYRWLTRHGLRPEDYHALFEVQEGYCAICRTPPGNGMFLHIDHCHTTGKIRGLLCPACNWALGCLKDSPDFCRSAAEYLETNGKLTSC